MDRDLSRWIAHKQTSSEQALKDWILSLKRSGGVLDKILGRDLAGIVTGYLEENDVYNILQEIAGKGFVFIQDAVKLIDENHLRPVRAVHFYCRCLNPLSVGMTGDFIFVSSHREGVLGWCHLRVNKRRNWIPLNPVAIARRLSQRRWEFAIYKENQREFCLPTKISGCCCEGTNLALFFNHVRDQTWLGYSRSIPPENKWYELYLPSKQERKNSICSCS